MPIKLLVTFLTISTTLWAQTPSIKKRIAWQHYHNAEKIIYQKISTTYNRAGQVLLIHFKQPHTDPDFNFDYIEERNTYDNKGRLLQTEVFSTDRSLSEQYQYEYNEKEPYYVVRGRSKSKAPFDYLSYTYTNATGAIAEKKAFDIDPFTGKKTLIAWKIYSYSKDGRLIGIRYKKKQENIFPIPAKIVYQYVPGTSTIAAILHYSWNAAETQDTIRTADCTYFFYNVQGQLIKKERGSRPGFQDNIITTYQYKNNQLWIEQERTPLTPRMKEYRTDKIYKDGILVRKKKYAIHYDPAMDRQELGERGLEYITDYQYEYYP